MWRGERPSVRNAKTLDDESRVFPICAARLRGRAVRWNAALLRREVGSSAGSSWGQCLPVPCGVSRDARCVGELWLVAQGRAEGPQQRKDRPGLEGLL